MRARAKFVYLFKTFQCVLSYQNLSLGGGGGKYKWTEILFSTRIFIKA